jgi:hypothetical protein
MRTRIPELLLHDANFSDPPDSLARSTMFAEVEPPHTYLRATTGSVVHHADYLDRLPDHALCGVPVHPASLIQPDPDAVCPDCEAKLIEYHLVWWRERAEAATAELEALRAKYGEIKQEQAGTTAIPDKQPEPTTVLDQARRELTKLCRQFDGAIPYWRLKNTMQAFSDDLDDQQRVLLAQEIGSDGSLIRWAATEVEVLGWSVANSPVQENSDMMWEEWLQESYQAPKKAKRRFGRSRSQDGG